MKLLDWLLTPWRKFKQYRQRKKRIKELRKKDPYIYF
jgi:uncharacterized protein YjiS (DUF1127 family)